MDKIKESQNFIIGEIKKLEKKYRYSMFLYFFTRDEYDRNIHTVYTTVMDQIGDLMTMSKEQSSMNSSIHKFSDKIQSAFKSSPYSSVSVYRRYFNSKHELETPIYETKRIMHR